MEGKPRSKAMLAYDVFVALFFAFSISAEPLMDFTGDVYSLYPDNLADMPGLFNLALFAFVFAAVLAVLRIVRKKLSGHIGEAGADGTGLAAHVKEHPFQLVVPWACVLAAWAPLLFQFYPGTGMNDQMWSINNPLFGTQPPMYGLFLSVLVRIAQDMFGSGAVGYAAFVAIQMALCSLVVGFCCAWLRYRRVPVAAIVIVAAFFALEPLVASYSVNAWKDTMFGYSIMLWVPLLWEAVRDPEKFWAGKLSGAVVIAASIPVLWLRTNGIALAVVLVAVLFISSAKGLSVKKAVFCASAMLVAAMVPIALTAPTNSTFAARESMNIVLQQVTASMAVDGEEGADEHYAPAFVDTVKFSEWGIDHLLGGPGLESETFGDLVVSEAKKHPDMFFRAYLSQTYGNWSLIASAPQQSYELSLCGNKVSSGEEKSLNQFREPLSLWNKSMYPESVQTWFEESYPSLLAFPGPGAVFALVILLGYALTVRHDSAKPLVVVVPLIALWATLMIATPLSTALRYVFPMIVSAPLFAALLFSKSSSD